MKALFLSAEHFEDTELLVPYYRLKEAGVDVDIASMRPGKLTGKHGYEVEASKSFDEVKAEEYGLLVLPGGGAPAAVRKEPAALARVRPAQFGGGQGLPDQTAWQRRRRKLHHPPRTRNFRAFRTGGERRQHGRGGAAATGGRWRI